MREIVVLSGKGGTGKTTMVGVFATLAEDAVFADTDVDAANLHVIFNPEVVNKEPFFGSQLPVVDQEECIRCGVCTDMCRFDAVHYGEVDEYNCEGCGVCLHVCSVGAITLKDVLSGYVYDSKTPYGPFFYAELGVAQESSGKLVVRVKEKARQAAKKENKAFLVVDGPPGIGCPAIAAMSGADLILAVTEPTAAGLHDLARVVGLARHFGTTVAVCVNKADLDESMASAIENYCRDEGLVFLGRIPFAKGVVKAQLKRAPGMEQDARPVEEAMKRVWRRALCL
ncbi:MAG: ATP-binding protein [Bacillota bacterium]